MSEQIKEQATEIMKSDSLVEALVFIKDTAEPEEVSTISEEFVTETFANNPSLFSKTARHDVVAHRSEQITQRPSIAGELSDTTELSDEKKLRREKVLGDVALLHQRKSRKRPRY